MEFSTTMFQIGNNTGIEVPPDIVDALAAGKRPAVTVTVNGYSYRSTVASMGGRYLVPFSSDKRAATGIRGGDHIDVEITLDTEPRTVELPEDFAMALAARPAALEAFEKLSPSARKAHVTTVEAAKTDATRQRRVTSIVEKLGG